MKIMTDEKFEEELRRARSEAYEEVRFAELERRVYELEDKVARLEPKGKDELHILKPLSEKPCYECFYGNYSVPTGWGCRNPQTCDANANLFEPIKYMIKERRDG